MKIKKTLKREDLPSGGRHYFSEQPMSELFLIINEVVEARPTRCDCDSYRRCWNCRTESRVESIRGELKKKIMEVFED